MVLKKSGGNHAHLNAIAVPTAAANRARQVGTYGGWRAWEWGVAVKFPCCLGMSLRSPGYSL